MRRASFSVNRAAVKVAAAIAMEELLADKTWYTTAQSTAAPGAFPGQDPQAVNQHSGVPCVHPWPGSLADKAGVCTLSVPSKEEEAVAGAAGSVMTELAAVAGSPTLPRVHDSSCTGTFCSVAVGAAMDK